MIAIGSDHAAFALKLILAEHLRNKGLQVRDFGVFTEEVKADYPPIAFAAAEAVAAGTAEWGILLCGTGIGMSVAANKVKGIRAALCSTGYAARMSREHNDANILVMGAWVVGRGLACSIVDDWLNAEFQEGIHANRLRMIKEFEESTDKA